MVCPAIGMFDKEICFSNLVTEIVKGVLNAGSS